MEVAQSAEHQVVVTDCKAHAYRNGKEGPAGHLCTRAAVSMVTKACRRVEIEHGCTQRGTLSHAKGQLAPGAANLNFRKSCGMGGLK